MCFILGSILGNNHFLSGDHYDRKWKPVYLIQCPIRAFFLGGEGEDICKFIKPLPFLSSYLQSCRASKRSFAHFAKHGSVLVVLFSFSINSSVFMYGYGVDGNSGDVGVFFPLRYVDALYLCTNAMTNTGLVNCQFERRQVHAEILDPFTCSPQMVDDITR